MYQKFHNLRQNVSSTILAEVINKITHKQLQLTKVNGFYQFPEPKNRQKYVLYAHVPFCESLCPYCSFNRFVFNEEKARIYFKNLRKEMEMLHDKGYDFVTMYIGGGTPTVLVDELVETIKYAKTLFSIEEVSTETNPNHLTKEILNALKGHVDRLSVGVQSFDDKLLKQMSRYHKYGSGDEILESIQNAVGILPSINVDMIYNLPDQTEAMIAKDVDYLLKTGAEQTTFYPLMSAPSVKKAMDRTLGKLDNKREIKYFRIISEGLQKNFKPSSAWTFSRNDTELIDEYIVKYEEYIGVGSGSFSYVDGKLLVNTFSLKKYNDLINQDEHPVYAYHDFTKKDKMRYRFLMELFDLSLDLESFKRDFGTSIYWGLLPEMAFMWLSGAFEKIENGRLYLREDSRHLMVVMMREFFSNVNVLRDQARYELPEDEKLMCVVDQKLYYNEFV